MLEGPILWAIGSGFVSAAFTGGVAWGTVKSALNGTRQRVRNVEEKVEALDEKMDEHQLEAIKEITAVSTKVDLLLGDRNG